MRFLISEVLSKDENEIIVNFENGKANIDALKYDFTVEIGIADFSSLFMGCASIKGLYNLGLLKLDKIDVLDELDRTFYCNQKPVCYTDF